MYSSMAATVRTRVEDEWIPASALAFRDAGWPIAARSALLPVATSESRMAGREGIIPVAPLERRF